MADKSNGKSGGIGCLTVVGIVFLVLKLLGVPPVAGWSWLWVTAPFWIPAALAIAFGMVCMLIILFAGSKD